jgi:tetratricopeptide (TPR) repeat protein
MHRAFGHARIWFTIILLVGARAWCDRCWAQTAPQSNLDDAHTLLEQGRADAAEILLKNFLTAKSTDVQTISAEANNLLCRVYYSEDRWNEAATACQAAVTIDPNSSAYHLWLGRAQGGQAEHATLVKAYQLAKRVRTEFETAVRLAPQDPAALRDLGEFYVDAPTIVGGGIGKARGVAAKLAPLDAEGHHWMLALITEEAKDYKTAEAELQAGVREAKDPSGAWMELASFYQRRGLLDAMEQAVQQGAAGDKVNSAALVDGASLLLRAGRNTDLAISLLRRYLDGGHLSEDAPAFVAHAKLADALRRKGDASGAAAELTAAKELAHGYEPGSYRGH